MSEWPFQVVMHYWSRGAQCSLKIINIPSVLVKSTIESITQNAVDEVGWKGGMEMMLVLARACFCVWTCKASQLGTACWKPSTNPVDGELVAQLSENPASDTSLVPRINSGTHADAVKTQKQNIKALSQSHSISSDSISPLSFLHRWSRCKSAIIPLTDWHSRLPKYGFHAKRTFNTRLCHPTVWIKRHRKKRKGQVTEEHPESTLHERQFQSRAPSWNCRYSLMSQHVSTISTLGTMLTSSRSFFYNLDCRLRRFKCRELHSKSTVLHDQWIRLNLLQNVRVGKRWNKKAKAPELGQVGQVERFPVYV